MYAPARVSIIPQGDYVARSLDSYLQRHPDMEQRCTHHAHTDYLTTENPAKFAPQAQLFLNEMVTATHIVLA